MKETIEIAKKVLKTNRRSGYTLPTNNELYPAQWNWDSAFISLGYSYFNMEYAIEELEKLVSGQWEDGMIPHILFHDNDESYFPNHKTWGCGNKIPSSGITQPPIIVTVIKKIVDQNKLDQSQMKRIESIVKKLKKYLDWFYNYRDTSKIGLVSIIHPWESGLDNSPIWDSSLDKVKIDENLSYERRDLNVSRSSNRPLKKDYDGYITLLNQFKKNKYNPSKIVSDSMFNVIDIGFNSILIRATKDLIELAKKFNLNFADLENKILKSEESLIKFYKDKDQSFFSYDFKNHKLINVDAISNYFILFANLQNQDINNRVINKLKKYNSQKEYFFTTVNPKDKTFEETRYWRGPVWINSNWIIYQGLKNKDIKFAKLVKKITLKLLEEKNFHEYYNYTNGACLGANNFSWSAALYLDFKFE
tara:strand:- start:14048 stop:15304 length:1257 start_codon:yes stop_codon:yes gene_type:complete